MINRKAFKQELYQTINSDFSCDRCQRAILSEKNRFPFNNDYLCLDCFSEAYDLFESNFKNQTIPKASNFSKTLIKPTIIKTFNLSIFDFYYLKALVFNSFFFTTSECIRETIYFLKHLKDQDEPLHHLVFDFKFSLDTSYYSKTKQIACKFPFKLMQLIFNLKNDFEFKTLTNTIRFSVFTYRIKNTYC